MSKWRWTEMHLTPVLKGLMQSKVLLRRSRALLMNRVGTAGGSKGFPSLHGATWAQNERSEPWFKHIAPLDRYCLPKDIPSVGSCGYYWQSKEANNSRKEIQEKRHEERKIQLPQQRRDKHVGTRFAPSDSPSSSFYGQEVVSQSNNTDRYRLTLWQLFDGAGAQRRHRGYSLAKSGKEREYGAFAYEIGVGSHLLDQEAIYGARAEYTNSSIGIHFCSLFCAGESRKR